MVSRCSFVFIIMGFQYALYLFMHFLNMHKSCLKFQESLLHPCTAPLAI